MPIVELGPIPLNSPPLSIPEGFRVSAEPEDFMTGPGVAKLALALVILAIIVIVFLYRRRKQIPSDIDSAVVGGFALGVRGARAVAKKGSNFKSRVIERADNANARAGQPHSGSSGAKADKS